jgi:sugar phosphate isomerase/epimerase
VNRVNNPALGINWDPANAFHAGEDRAYPDGYRAVKGQVKHVHYKQSSILSNGKRGFTPNGSIDWPAQIGELLTDGYEGWITVEPHIRPKVSATRQAVGELKRLLGR